MLRVISLNINGIRSGARKGFFTWLAEQNADVICLQEIKAEQIQLSDAVFFPEGYHHYFFSAEKKGYSGVAIYAKQEPENVRYGLGWPLADSEGRFLQLDWDKLSIASVYFPSGSSGEIRQSLKFEFMEKFLHDLIAMRSSKRDHIICGDFNIVHQQIDIKNWAGNQKNSGCLPQERAWFDDLLTQYGWVDAFRHLNQEPEQYTWWSNRGNARANNVGWRIDYQLITPGLKRHLHSTAIYKEQWFSDHAPLIVNYDLDLCGRR